MTFRRVALGSLTILAVAYGVAPWLAERLLPPLLARWGVESSQFSFGYPRWNGVDVKALSLATADTTVAGHDIRISYRLMRLLGGEVEAVDIGDLTVRLGRSTATPQASGNFDIASFWTLIPARRVVIRKLDIANAEPAVAALGTVNFDPEVLHVKLGVESPLLAVPLDVDGAVNPDGRVALTLTERGSAAPLGSLTGVPDRDGNAMTVDGRIALSGRPLALAAAYSDATVSSGSVEINVSGRTVWPLPAEDVWKAFDGKGTFKFELAGAPSQVSEADVRVLGDFTVANGEVKARLESGGLIRANVPELRRAGGKAALDSLMTISNDQDVAVEYAERNVRIGDGLVVAVSAAGKPLRVRARGAFGADGHFELGVVGLDGSPIVLATGVPEGVDRLAVKAQLALTGKVLQTVGAAAGIGITGGHVVTDFEGNLRLAPKFALKNVEGRGRLGIALSGRLAPERRFDAAIEGDYSIGDSIGDSIGRSIKVVLDAGVHIVLAPDGFELSTVSPLTLEMQPNSSQLRVRSFDLKAALPPMNVGKHTIALSNAWMSVEQLTMDGGAIGAAAVLRTHSGRDAMAVRVTVSHDLVSATGAFSASGNAEVTKALLATQLPGFNAAYDVDEGSIALTLDGSWDASKALTFDAKGRVRIDGRKAHYDDYTIAGLKVDMPFLLSGESLTVADNTLTIQSFDVGFPLTDISLNFAVANGFARVHGLSGNVLGGRFAADPFEYELATDKTSIAINLDGIELANVLALEGEDVRGSGVLDGKLPVALDGEIFTVTDGSIVARPPGGTLIYKGAAASSMVAQSGVGFAFQALEDFRYDTLDANVALATDGALKLAVKLQGFNPAVEQGRAIQFNLNLSESLPALLQSLRAADNITESLEKRFGS